MCVCVSADRDDAYVACMNTCPLCILSVSVAVMCVYVHGRYAYVCMCAALCVCVCVCVYVLGTNLQSIYKVLAPHAELI